MNPRSLFLRKLVSDTTESAATGGLKRTLTAVDLTFLGIGAIIGAGLFSSIKEMIVGRFRGRRHPDDARRGAGR
jgi:amino acid permease